MSPAPKNAQHFWISLFLWTPIIDCPLYLMMTCVWDETFLPLLECSTTGLHNSALESQLGNNGLFHGGPGSRLRDCVHLT
ncbi:hypothetical protein AAFF_G00063780 [Aldrovandia affinis]|uniref:Uncharacterized protein n=1 Tax=Aldrovandia affinis TaxID=143900 RepID=A0AAD7T3K7_9TELE|nr:hypothetical protein AAFF_G00063780 [Aldrovandia affinis]